MKLDAWQKKEQVRRRAERDAWVKEMVDSRSRNNAYAEAAARAFWRREFDAAMEENPERAGFSWRRRLGRPTSFPLSKSHLHWCRTLRRGQEVAACEDGKVGRAVRAKVVWAHKGVVVAEFPRWAGEGVARVRFVDGAGRDRGERSIIDSRKGTFYRLQPADEPADEPTVRAVLDEQAARELLTEIT